MAAQSDWDISVEDLKGLLDAQTEFRLIDVREPSELLELDLQLLLIVGLVPAPIWWKH